MISRGSAALANYKKILPASTSHVQTATNPRLHLNSLSFAKIKRSLVPGKKSSIADKTLHLIRRDAQTGRKSLDGIRAGRQGNSPTESKFGYRLSQLFSGGEIVTMMQSAQPGSRNNSLCPASSPGGTLVWRFLPQPEMRSILVVIAHIFGQKALQMALIEHNDMIEQVSATPVGSPC